MISNILKNAHDEMKTNIPPTLIYNEGWMLRLVKKWFQNNPNANHKLAIPEDCSWYSEALLPSPFLFSPPGTKIAEGYTHADGVAGKFDIGLKNKGELSLKPNCDYFYVAEAKMYSSLSTGTTNAPNYNQAARNVACIADIIVRGGLTNQSFKKLGFYVLLPEDHPDMESIKEIMQRENIIAAIKDRLIKFQEPYDKKPSSINWLGQNLNNFVNNTLDIDIITWKEIVDFINDDGLNDFYEHCKNFNMK